MATNYTGKVNYTNPVGKTFESHNWCNGPFCYAEEVGTGRPVVHPHASGYSQEPKGGVAGIWFEDFTPQPSGRPAFARPAYGVQ
eukprot:gene3576-3616_t